MESLLGAMVFAVFITAQAVAVIVLNGRNTTLDERPSVGRVAWPTYRVSDAMR
jgi:hypothetical protein